MAKTWGTIARAETAKHKCRYFDDVLAEIRQRLSPRSALVLAAACAERLLVRHFALPSKEHRRFTVSWRDPMNALWRALTSAGTLADRRTVEGALDAYYGSPLNHSDGPDGPDDADHDPAAACIYAAESFLKGDLVSAFHGTSRLVDDAFSRAAESREQQTTMTGGVSDFVEECCHWVAQEELQWLLDLTGLVETIPLTDEVIAEVRKQTGAQPGDVPGP